MILNPQMGNIWGTLQGDYLIKRMIFNDPRIRPSMSICGKRNYKWKLIIRKKAKIAYFDILAIFKKIFIYFYMASSFVNTMKDKNSKRLQKVPEWLWNLIVMTRGRNLKDPLRSRVDGPCQGLTIGSWTGPRVNDGQPWKIIYDFLIPLMIKWQNWILHITFTWQ